MLLMESTRSVPGQNYSTHIHTHTILVAIFQVNISYPLATLISVIIISIIIINVLIKETLNEIRCRGTLQSRWSTLTDSTSLKAEESVNVTDESRSSWYSSWNGTGGSSDDGGRWRQTRHSKWNRGGDSMILPLLREMSGRRELIALCSLFIPRICIFLLQH